MLHFLDLFLLVFHVALVLFNMFGWIWRVTRQANLISMSLTTVSWFGLGIFYGLGYCILTDWHWEIKRELGETDLPISFVKYLSDNYTPFTIDASTIDLITGLGFAFAIIGCSTVNIRDFLRRRESGRERAKS